MTRVPPLAVYVQSPFCWSQVVRSVKLKVAVADLVFFAKRVKRKQYS